MRNTPNLRAEKCRLRQHSSREDGNNGAFVVRCNATAHATELFVIVSDGLGWDHVSVSLGHRCPSWDEMCFVKELFFRDDEVVYQLHPAKRDYLSNHPYCLHMWRPQGESVPTPPLELVGVAGVANGVVVDRNQYASFLGTLDPETKERAVEAYGAA